MKKIAFRFLVVIMALTMAFLVCACGGTSDKTNIAGSGTASDAIGGNGTSGDSGTDDETYYTITFETNGGSVLTSLAVKENVVPTAPTAPTHSHAKFDGWFVDQDCTSSFAFDTALTEDVRLYAKWDTAHVFSTDYTVDVEPTCEEKGSKSYHCIYEECNEKKDPVDIIVTHELNENCVCTRCFNTYHGKKNGEYCRHGDAIYFGTYPQCKEENASVTSALNALAGALPTENDSKNWTSYGYYIGGEVKDYTWYIDLEYKNERYRGVYFTLYTPTRGITW